MIGKIPWFADYYAQQTGLIYNQDLFYISIVEWDPAQSYHQMADRLREMAQPNCMGYMWKTRKQCNPVLYTGWSIHPDTGLSPTRFASSGPCLDALMFRCLPGRRCLSDKSDVFRELCSLHRTFLSYPCYPSVRRCSLPPGRAPSQEGFISNICRIHQTGATRQMLNDAFHRFAIGFMPIAFFCSPLCSETDMAMTFPTVKIRLSYQLK